MNSLGSRRHWAPFGPERSPVQVWAVEDTSVQLTWGDLPAGTVTAGAQGAQSVVEHGGGPGGLILAGLTPDSSVSIDVTWGPDIRAANFGHPGHKTLETATLPTPPGQPMARFATISDLHLGAHRWGALKNMTDTSGHEVPHPYRCARAAIAEAINWGAELLVIKGDAVQHESDGDFAQLARLVDEFPELPMLLIPGNHEVDGRHDTIPLTVGERALPYTRRVDVVDLPGVRILVGDTSIPGNGKGTLSRISETLLDLACDSGRPVFIGIHHQLQPNRLPRYWPIGIRAPESTRFLNELNRLHQPVTVSSGHTHRNRSRFHGDVLVTEVASTKDWPGVWAGYAVHEGGIRQVVRRTTQPEAIDWTEYSRRAVGGLWGMWSPGSMEQRCLSLAWARDASLVR